MNNYKSKNESGFQIMDKCTRQISGKDRMCYIVQHDTFPNQEFHISVFRFKITDDCNRGQEFDPSNEEETVNQGGGGSEGEVMGTTPLNKNLEALQTPTRTPSETPTPRRSIATGS